MPRLTLAVLVLLCLAAPAQAQNQAIYTVVPGRFAGPALAPGAVLWASTRGRRVEVVVFMPDRAPSVVAPIPAGENLVLAAGAAGIAVATSNGGCEPDACQDPYPRGGGVAVGPLDGPLTAVSRGCGAVDVAVAESVTGWACARGRSTVRTPDGRLLRGRAVGDAAELRLAGSFAALGLGPSIEVAEPGSEPVLSRRPGAPFDVAPDGSLVVFDAERGQVVRASPGLPEQPLFAADDVDEVRVAGGRIATLSDVAYRRTIAVHTDAGAEVARHTWIRQPNSERFELAFDGERVAWALRPCRSAIIQVWQLGQPAPGQHETDCAIPRLHRRPIRVGPDGRIPLLLACTTECHGTAQVRFTAGGVRRTSRTAAYALRNGAERLVRPRLRSADLRALRRSGASTATVELRSDVGRARRSVTRMIRAR